MSAALLTLPREPVVEAIHADVCGLYFRSVLLPKMGMRIYQHEHEYDHPTYCGNGSAEYWEEGKLIGNVKAGDVVEVKAAKKHFFVALEDNTRLTCVHSVESETSLRKRGL